MTNEPPPLDTMCAAMPPSLECKKSMQPPDYTHLPSDRSALHKPPPAKMGELKVPRAMKVELRAKRFAADHFGASIDEVAGQTYPDLPKSLAIDRLCDRWREKWPEIRAAASAKRQRRRVRAGSLPAHALLLCPHLLAGDCGTVPPWDWHAAGPGTMPPAGQSRHGLGAAIICALTRLPRAPAMPCSALIVLCARQAKSAASVLPSSLRCSADEAWAPGSGPPRARSCAVQIFRGLSIGWQLCWRVVVINTQSAHGARAARSVEPMRTPALYSHCHKLGKHSCTQAKGS